MIKRLFTLFKLGRKIAKSEALAIATKFNEPPFFIKIFFKIIGFSFLKNNETNQIKSEEKKLSDSMQSMGTTFIKLGQFLATRPDIIGDELFKIQSKKNYKFDYILLDKDKFIYKCFGKFLGSFVVYQLSQLYNLIKYREKSKNWYFDFFFKR